MEFLQNVFGIIGDLTWGGWALIPFLVIIGLFFTLASRFVQFEFFGRMFNVLKRRIRPKIQCDFRARGVVDFSWWACWWR